MGSAVVVVTEVVPVPEQVEIVEHSVVKDVVCDPETKFVPLQLVIAVGVHVLVIPVTRVMPAPEHALVVVQDVIVVWVMF